MKWIEALKLYNAKNGKWVVPRKGSPEYDEVRKIMAKEVEGGMEKHSPMAQSLAHLKMNKKRKQEVLDKFVEAAMTGKAEEAARLEAMLAAMEKMDKENRRGFKSTFGFGKVSGGMLKALRERELGNKKPMEKMEEKQRRKAYMDKLVNNMLEALKSGTHSLDAMHAFLAKPGLRPVDDYVFSDAEKAEMKDMLDSAWQMWALDLSDTD